MGSDSGEGVPLEVLPALYLSVVAPLLVQSSGATLPNLSKTTDVVVSLGRCS